MMETCDACIERACDELENLGWTRQSVKAIGEWNVIPSGSIIFCTDMEGAVEQRGPVWERLHSAEHLR